MNRTISAGAAPSVWSRLVGPSRRDRDTLRALAVFALLWALNAHAQPAPVLQRGYDANVSGATLSETILNTSNVVPGSFGLAFTLPVDDSIMMFEGLMSRWITPRECA